MKSITMTRSIFCALLLGIASFANAKVLISSPINGANLPAAVHVVAQAGGPRPSTMNAYLNGKLVARSKSSAKLTADLTLKAGMYQLKVTAQTGTRTSSETITFTVAPQAPPPTPTPDPTPTPSPTPGPTPTPAPAPMFPPDPGNPSSSCPSN